MVRVFSRVNGVLAACSFLFVRIPCCAQSPVDQVWQAIGDRPEAVEDITFTVEATYYIATRPVRIHWWCALKPPDKAYMVIRDSEQFPSTFRPFPPDKGTEIIINGPATVVRNGLRNTVRRTNGDGSELPPPLEKIGPWEIPKIEAYLRAYMRATSGQGITEVTESRAGAPGLKTVTARLDPPLKWMEPHAIANLTWTVDEAKRVPVRFEALDEDGTPAVTTEYLELTEVAGDKWVALRSETTVAPGMIPTPPARTETEGAHIRVDGMTVSTEHTWMPDAGLCVVVHKAYADDEGRPLMDIMFDGYAVDLGLDDSLFETEAPEEPDERPEPEGGA